MYEVPIKNKFRCYEAKIEESEKAGSCQESNPGHLACAASALSIATCTDLHVSTHLCIFKGVPHRSSDLR